MEKACDLKIKVDQLKRRGVDREVLDRVLAEMGEVAFQEGNIYLAVKAFKALNNPAGLKKAGDLGLRTGNLYDALRAYKLIENEKGLREGIDIAVKQGKTNILSEAIPDCLEQKVLKRYKGFLKNKGFEHAVTFELYEVLNAANELAPDHDIGIALAKGGLFSGYIFSLFDLPVIVAEAHRKGRGATFKWHDSPEQLKDKKILVFDKDVIKGRTLGRAIKEIKKYSPKEVDLFLNYNPVEHGYYCSIGSNISSVPEGFREIFYPKILNYSNFYNGILKIKEKMEK